MFQGIAKDSWEQTWTVRVTWSTPVRISTPLDRKKVIATSVKAEAVGKAIVDLITTSTDNSRRITCRLIISSGYRAIGIVAGCGHN